jgi:DNA-directed RNA polymerase specialized sigma24 family protein
MTNPSNIEPGSPSKFASTHWSVVLAAGCSPASPEALSAMARLCSTYWYPLYAFIRRQGHQADAAEELTQEFFARFLERDFLEAVDRNKGRFRSFLLACCRHFLANQRDFARALKRGGGQPALALDFHGVHERYQAEPAAALSAEKLFERRWALTLLEQVMIQLRQEYVAQGKGELFDHLQKVLVGESEALSYARIAAALNMTEDAVKKAAQRLRQRYGILLREQIAATVDDPAKIDEEIRDLFAALAAS